MLYTTKKEALWAAFGGSVPEYIYCMLAVYMNSFFEDNTLFQTIFQITFVIVLFAISIVFWVKKENQTIATEGDKSKAPLFCFFKGFSLAILNPQLLPFWVFVQVYFNSVKFLEIQSGSQKISFILGAGTGAFILLTILIILVNKYKMQILRYINNKFYFKALSILFFAIAIQQLNKLIF